MTRFAWDEEVLRSLPILSSLSSEQLKCLLPSLRRGTYPARACILHAGDPPDGLYIIVSGRVRLRHQDQHGRALIADTFGPKEFFGEIGLLDVSPCPASVEAAENCELVYIPRERLLECLGQNAAAAVCMLRVALHRLGRAHRQMANLALTKVYARVVQVLLENGQELHGEWHVNIGAEQIGEMVGASREMVSRVLKCMIQQRLVRRDKRKLIVIDRDTLIAQPSSQEGGAGLRGSEPPDRLRLTGTSNGISARNTRQGR